MLNETEKDKYKRLKHEIIDMYFCAYAYIERHNHLLTNIRERSRFYIIQEFIALQYLERGLIVHLVNLDEEKTNFSVRSILKYLKKNNIGLELDKELKFYRNKLIAPIKTSRNSSVAHMNSSSTPEFYESYHDYNSLIKPAILKISGIADAIWGKKIEVKYKFGSQEGVLDLREIVSERVLS